MGPRPPSDDTERVLLSGLFTQLLSLGLAWSLIVLPFFAGLAWWRWGAPLRQVTATLTGLLVSRPGREWFIPYPLVESAKESRLSRLRTVTVTLRAPVGGLRRFAFIPPRRFVRLNDAHPMAAELERRLETSRSG